STGKSASKSTGKSLDESTGKPERSPAGSTAALARDHVIRQSASGLLTITGGKWTTYRQMGEDAVDRVVAIASLPSRPSQTRHPPLHGWTTTPAPAPLTVYGSDAHSLQQLPGIEVPLHDRLPYSEAEVRWAARYELARTVEDLLARRTRALLLDAAASLEAAPRVAALLSEELGYDAAWQQQQLADYGALARGYQL
ncbi:MAG TPA: glycerol-3-phosphate dehydrogenase C-terminal domain-containing protein, partial [Chroococcidiopsis sp.]